MINNGKKRVSQEIVKHFRDNSGALRRRWVKEMTASGLVKRLTLDEVEIESRVIYDTCVSCFETGNYKGAEKYAQAMAEKGVLEGMKTEEIIGGMLTLRDVYGRSLFYKYREEQAILDEMLMLYEPVANKILSIVAMAFVEEKTRDLEKMVKERTRELEEKIKELEKFSRLTVGRELRMMELKKTIKEIKSKSEEPGK